MIRLTLFDGSWHKTREFDADVVTIGRSSESVFEIKEPSISRLHCEIALVSGKAMLINHAKTNGTLVNGKPVGEAILNVGDEIMLGRVRVRFEGSTNAAAPPAAGESEGSGVRKKLLHRRRRD